MWLSMWIGLELQGNAACFPGTSLWGVQGLAAKTGDVCLPSKYPKVNHVASKVETTTCLASLHNSSRHVTVFFLRCNVFSLSQRIKQKGLAAKVLKLGVLLWLGMKDCLTSYWHKPALLFIRRAIRLCHVINIKKIASWMLFWAAIIYVIQEGQS